MTVKNLIYDLQLTPDFKLREFAVSAEYPKLADAMRFSELEATKLFYLCSFILQPLRQLVAKPITILSGKRTPELNKAIGGGKSSQHLKCEAADFMIPNADMRFDQEPSNPLELRDTNFIHKNLQDVFRLSARNFSNIWHQIIIYYTDDWRPRFIHVSIPPSPVGAVREPLLLKKRKGAFYHHKGQFYKLALERSEGLALERSEGVGLK